MLPVQNNFYAPVVFPVRLFLHHDNNNALRLFSPCWLVTRPPGLGCDLRHLSRAVAVASFTSTAKPQGLNTYLESWAYLSPTSLSVL